MSEYKQLKTRIWQDNWFLTLTPEEKLLWIFLLTNEYSHISGLYELPEPLVRPLTGVKDFEKILLKFAKDNKIKYKNGWIYILNKNKHQPISNNLKDKINISIKSYFDEHKDILAKFKEKDKPLVRPLQGPCKPLPQVEVEVEEEVEVEYNISLDKSNDLSNEREFNFINYINDLISSKRKDLQIIGLYWQKKEFNLPLNAIQPNIKRELKPAKALIGYSNEQISKVMDYLNEFADFKWTLETVFKYINEPKIK